MAIPFRASTVVATPEITGVILAIDYGKKRLGLALSDRQGLTASPFATWTRINRRRDLARLRDLARRHDVRRIVVGLPLHLDGTPSEMSEEAKSFGARVEKALGIPVEMMDERLSSWEAKQNESKREFPPRIRRSFSRGTERVQRPPIDDAAAAIILRDYLSRTHPSELPEANLEDILREVELSDTGLRDGKSRDHGSRHTVPRDSKSRHNGSRD